ncbi:TetR/AcrR family transcriptional regulator [Roseateles sp. SL47]|uniref:TetR/AcrR family transcriptional regulator n=1 Tax=Roseateles sp. SL47 TaxID=2995138 RepID=UPI00226DF391|nr:TetR/AcrR family transcriptional regulator [Roseateles sp. SL47]WAC72998.1 TetR/AcrR family transcriptional regulator [Roseateles sp. SL47]
MCPDLPLSASNTAPAPASASGSAAGDASPLRLTDRKRQAIVDAAIAEFREYGFEVANMDRIAARAQVSKRTVYNHFSGKDALFEAIVERLWSSTKDDVEVPYQPTQPLRPQLMALIQKKLGMMNDEQFINLARVLIAEAIHTPERAREMLARLGSREEGVTVWVRAAVEDGRLNAPDPVFASAQLQALVKGFAFWPQITMGQPHLTEAEQQRVAASTADLFLRSYAAARETSP